MPEYPNNSNAARNETPEAQKKEINKVSLSAPAKTKKRSPLSKLGDNILSDDRGSIGDHIWHDVAGPMQLTLYFTDPLVGEILDPAELTSAIVRTMVPTVAIPDEMILRREEAPMTLMSSLSGLAEMRKAFWMNWITSSDGIRSFRLRTSMRWSIRRLRLRHIAMDGQICVRPTLRVVAMAIIFVCRSRHR